MLDRPFNPYSWVVPDDPRFTFRGIFFGNLVEDLGHIAQHAKTMGKTRGYV